MRIADGENAQGLKLRLFGFFEAWLDGAPLLGLRRREGERLLAFLTFYQGVPLPYRTLAEQFWPGEARQNAGISGDYPNTRQAVRALRQSLGAEAYRLGSAGKGVVCLDLTGADVDLLTFDRLTRSDSPVEWRQALALYRNPLLDGWTEKWVLEERARRKRNYERTLQNLVEYATTQGDPDEAESCLCRLVESNPCDETRAALDAVLRGRTRVSASTTATPHLSTSTPERQVALLYKRNTEPDESVMRMLEQELNAAGYRVFVDRNIMTGVQWAREIEKQLRASYAIIPLLSETSINSEMLEYEIEKALEAAQIQGGLPRILPVRVAYSDRLREGSSLAGILEPLHYTLWNDDKDNARVASELLLALRTSPASPPEPIRLEPTGGAVPLDSKFYVTRPVDSELREAISRQDSVVLVKGARQMGKTSLLARGLQQARESGAKVVLTDFQKLHETQLESPERLYTALATSIAMQLGLNVSPRQDWDADLGPNMNMELFFRTNVLTAFKESIVWALDEVDRLFAYPFASEVFGLFRSWHNERSLDPTGPWQRLTLAIAYATEAHLFIQDDNQSPFNIGTRLALDDFDLDQVSELNRRYQSPLNGAEAVTRYHRLTAGQPYLVRRGFDEMVKRKLSLEDVEERGARDEGPFGDHLRRILAILARDAELGDVVRDVLQGRQCPTSERFYRLRSAGILAGESLLDARLRCPLYAAYLSRHLL